MKQDGFTLIEMILCVVAVGFLTASFLPSFGTILGDSGQKSGAAASQAVQDAINARVSANKIMGVEPVVPVSLDDVDVNTESGGVKCVVMQYEGDADSSCFYSIAEDFTALGWTKLSENTYQYVYNAGWVTYEYVANEDAGYGTFACLDSSDGTCGSSTITIHPIDFNPVVSPNGIDSGLGP